MSRLKTVLSTLTVMIAIVGSVAIGAYAQNAFQISEVPASALVTKTVTAVGYEVGAGGTKVDMVATDLMPSATGQADVEIKSKSSTAAIEIDVKGLQAPSSMGAEFLTYVAWTVTPEGRAGNLGEILLNKDGNGKLNATSPAQTFSIIVTAEPYFAVRFPSEMVVMQSQATKKTKGKIFPVSEYKLMRRSQYQQLGNPLALTPDLKAAPLQMYEARNAISIAKSHQVPKYAPDIYTKADASLKMAENALSGKQNWNSVVSLSRQTCQFAEDARLLTLQRQEAERIENEKLAAAAAAKAAAEAKAATEAAEAKRIADQKAAEAKAKAAAELAAQQAKAKSELEAQQAKAAAEIAAQEAARQQAEKEKAELRGKLLEQFNRVLPTTDSPRGLVVNMGDVLFAVAKSNLEPPAQIALAKLSGIILNYPSLHLSIEGYTDSTGTVEFNQTLSEKRADAVQDFLVSQGLSASSLSANGFGPADPVADNKTAAGRQKNRRVEIVVSGEVIGTAIGTKTN
jgi:outer membrane protein OmpA-like peptidoglycan-associated protein